MAECASTPPVERKDDPMKTKATHGARNALGLIFFVSGLDGFLNLIPQPPMSGPAEGFFGALIAASLFPLLRSTEVVAGALLLSGRLVPLGLTALAPMIVNIAAFHLFLAQSALPVPVACELGAEEIVVGDSGEHGRPIHTFVGSGVTRVAATSNCAVVVSDQDESRITPCGDSA